MLVYVPAEVKDVQQRPHEAKLTFPAWIESQASQFEINPTPERKWLANEIRKLARTADSICATDPVMFDDHLEALQHMSDQDLMAQGRDEGYAAAIEDMARVEQWGA